MKEKRRKGAPESQSTSRDEQVHDPITPDRQPTPTSSTPIDCASSSSPDSPEHLEIEDINPSEITFVDSPTVITEFVPLTRISPPPEYVIDAIDVPYISFYNAEMPKIHPYAAIFPRFIPDLMQMGTSAPPLLHSLISIAAVITDTVQQRPQVRALIHHHITLRTLQDAITSMTGPHMDEAMIYAVMMLGYFNLFSARFLSARRHLRGLSLMLHSYLSSGRVPSAMTMLIWRCAIRLDTYVSSVYPCRPIFPTPPEDQQDAHRIWIRAAVRPLGEEWAMAQFALDNLQSRAAHLSWSAYESRRKGTANETNIQIQCMNLLADFSVWRRRKVFLEEDSLEELLQQHRPAAPVQTFLHHPPLPMRNTFYANLLNEFRLAVMFVTFIASPRVGGHSLFDAVRKSHAIDCCRSMAATGVSKFPVALVRILQLAGLVFADPPQSSAECAWILEQLDKLIARGVLGALRVKEMLGVVWESPRIWTYEETERIMLNADDLEALATEECQDV